MWKAIYQFLYRRKPSYIEWDRRNSMWNDGHLHVYVKGVNVESIFIDDLEDPDGYVSPYDIIEQLRDKYQITEVRETGYVDWR